MSTLEKDIEYLNESYVARKNSLKYSVENRGNDFYIFLNDEVIAVGTDEEIASRIDILSKTFRRIALNRGNRV